MYPMPSVWGKKMFTEFQERYNVTKHTESCVLGWYAVRTPDTSAAEKWLIGRCDATYIPRRTVLRGANSKPVSIPLLPHFIFVRMDSAGISDLEREATDSGCPLAWLKVMRVPADNTIRPIPEREMRLFRLLTSDSDAERCEIYGKPDFRAGQTVRITAGIFEGYTGYVRRIRNNRHIVVEIDGLCAIALPFIHPSMLQAIDANI